MAANADLSRGPVLLAMSVSTGCFTLSTCIVRFCVRKRISHNVGIDDYAIGLASVVGLVGTIFSIIESVSMTDSAHALEFDWLGQPWFMMGATLAKISICLFFIRLVGAVKQWRILLSTQIFLMAVLNLAFSMTTNLQCRPLGKLWDPAVPGECWSPSVQLNIGYFQGAFSVFWWLFLSLFPVMIVRDLEMHRRMKWPFYFLSSLSLIAGIFATVRTYETSQTVPGVYTFDTFFATVLSILEQNVGIVAANVLPVGPLFSRRQREAIRAESRMSGRSALASRQSNANGTLAKRSSMLIIEGPRQASFEGDTALRNISRGNRDADSNSVGESNASDGWPRGIIKTVEVQVVEEDITDIERRPEARLSRSSGLSVDHDWATLLRSGPTPPGSRGPSRLA